MTPYGLDQRAVAEAPPLAVWTPRRALSTASAFVSLGKPRIISLLLITAFCAMVVADHGLPRWQVAGLTLLGLALSAGGANAVNMWFDRDIDRLMARTRGRPLPTGRILPAHALVFGISCQAASLAVLAAGVNWLTAMLAFGGFVYYVVVYTFWLKRRTPQNIVIGGGAGAFPPLVGWAAVTGAVGLPAVLMFLIVFLWTPPHFWSLALYRQEDYRRAGIPMMPVARGARPTKWQSLVYAALLLPVSAMLFETHAVGWVFLVVAAVLGVGFVGFAIALLVEREPDDTWAKRTFRYSLLYLTGMFAAMVVAIHPL